MVLLPVSLCFCCPQEKLCQLFLRILVVMDDSIDGRTDGQLYMKLLRERQQSLYRIDPFRQFRERLARYKVFAEAAVIAVRREQCGLVIARCDKPYTVMRSPPIASMRRESSCVPRAISAPFRLL